MEQRIFDRGTLEIEGYLVVLGNIKTNGNLVDGYIGISDSTTFQKKSYDGDIKLYGGLILKNNFAINGNIGGIALEADETIDGELVLIFL